MESEPVRAVTNGWFLAGYSNEVRALQVKSLANWFKVIGLRIQTIWSERTFVASPMEEGLRFAGTVELAGLSAPPAMERADLLLRQGLKMFPQLRPAQTRRWMGHRPGMPDTIPVIDGAPRHRNAVFAFGHGHMGLIGGSVTGKLISEMVSGKPATIDMSPYRADRF